MAHIETTLVSDAKEGIPRRFRCRLPIYSERIRRIAALNPGSVLRPLPGPTPVLCNRDRTLRRPVPLGSRRAQEKEQKGARLVGRNGKERNNSVDTADLLLIDYDKEPFLALRFLVLRVQQKENLCACVCEV